MGGGYLPMITAFVIIDGNCVSRVELVDVDSRAVIYSIYRPRNQLGRGYRTCRMADNTPHR